MARTKKPRTVPAKVPRSHYALAIERTEAFVQRGTMAIDQSLMTDREREIASEARREAITECADLLAEMTAGCRLNLEVMQHPDNQKMYYTRGTWSDAAEKQIRAKIGETTREPDFREWYLATVKGPGSGANQET